MTVKDKILKRHTEYIESLKKELICAKNIIKDPKKLTKYSRAMGSKEISLYRYFPTERENQSVDKNSRVS
jgi:hypothetical protein